MLSDRWTRIAGCYIVQRSQLQLERQKQDETIAPSQELSLKTELIYCSQYRGFER